MQNLPNLFRPRFSSILNSSRQHNYLANQPSVHYPIDAFHITTHDAAKEVIFGVGAPPALIGMSFLMTQSAACQGLIDIQLPTGQIRPVSLNGAGIAVSGERKSSIDNLVAAPILKYDLQQAKFYKVALLEYEKDNANWIAIDRGLRRRLTKLAEKGEPIEEAQQELAKHVEKKPVRPRMRSMQHQKMSSRALIDAVEGDGESIALMSDEGEIILKSGALQQTGVVNRIWDGSRVAFDSHEAGSVVANDPRLTIWYQIQPQVFLEYYRKRGEVTRGSGHFARYLIAFPESTQGTRWIWKTDHEWVSLLKFHERVYELLDEYGEKIRKGNIKRTVVQFSEEAKRRWIEVANQHETALGPQGYWRDIRDFASKMMEIVGRVAAILHWFSKQEGDISVDTFERAHEIVLWHAEEFKRIFTEIQTPQEQLDAVTLENYLGNRFWCQNHSSVPKNFVLHNGPVRPKARFDAALNVLAQMNRLRVAPDSKSMYWIAMNPDYFNSKSWH